MNDPANTTPEMLLRAAAIARANGLRYVYAGNLPGQVGDLENTRCHACQALLVERYGYFVQQYRITPRGTCPDCHTSIPGRWGCEVRRTDHGPAVPAWQQAPAHALTTGPAAVLDSPRPFTMSAPDISGYADVPPTPGTTTRSGGDRIPPPPAPRTLARHRLESPAESGILWRDTGAAAGDRPP